MIARQHLALQDLQRQGILNEPLDSPPQRPRTICRIVTLAQKQFLRRGCQLERNLPLHEQLLHALQQQADDALQMLFPEWVEDHNLVDPVEELRSERSA